jgi:type I restriction enzyme S subunit
MSSEWRTVRLSEVASEVTVGFVGTMANEYVDSGIPFLRSLNVGRLKIDTYDIRYISQDFHSRISKSRLRPGDVVIVRTGKPGTCAVIPEELPNSNCSDLVIVRCGAEILNRFLCYYVNSAASNHIAAHTVGAVQQHFNVASAKTMEIPLPPLGEQKVIAHILGTLDDKIELNRKTNETLEAMAKAHFKSWFVDFDPVRAKAEGRPTGLPAEISDLFPDSFEDSELGEIPSGWEVDSIYSVASVTYGAPFSSSSFNGEGNGTPVARIRDLPGESPGVFTTEVHPKGILIAPGDIVVGMDGEFRAYLWGGEECWMNQRVCKFIPDIKGRTCFLRESIRKPLMDVEMSETATTVIHLGKGDIDGFRVVVPTQEILDIFSAATTPLCEEVVANKQQARVLANIRDALLPKLISGEIRIPDAEKMLENFLS